MTENIENHIEYNNTRDEIENLSFCVFDLETTGGNHQSDKIIEIGLVKIENLKIIEEKNYLIRPEIKIPDFIQKLTNIKEEDVVNAPLIEDVIDEIVKFMGDSILVAHNTSFDIPFFNSVLRRLKKPELENKSLCTNLMTKYLIPNLLNTNLNYMSKIFSIKHRKAHRALDDAYAAAELLLRYLDIFIHKDIQKINHLYYPRNRYELDRVHYKKKTASSQEIEKRLHEIKTPFLATIKGENGVILFALPGNQSEKEKTLLLEKINTLDWEIITFKLFGSYTETLINFNGLFSKMDSHNRNEAINFLWESILNKKRPYYDQDAPPINTNNDLGDFIITTHLVPEQLIILPMSSLNLKNQLIFRYPGHRKKLLQFINSKSARMSNQRLKSAYYHPHLKEFMNAYFTKLIEQDDSGVFIFKKHIPQKNPEHFYEKLEEFLSKNTSSYHYPKSYI